jgi:hypothetical protein
MEKLYIPYKYPSSLSGWKECWFYIGNHAPSLPESIARVPKITRGWTKQAPELSQVNKLLAKIKILRDEGVTGVLVMYSWIGRRIQLLQQRSHFGFKYMDLKDPSRFSEEQVYQAQALRQLSRVLLDARIVPYMPSKLFTIKNPPNQVMVSSRE